MTVSSFRLAVLLSLGLVGTFAAGCEPPEAEPTGAVASAITGAEAYGLGWAKQDDGVHDGSLVIRADLWIAAPVDRVWELVRNPNGYETFNKALTAHADRVEVGQPIALAIRMFGDALPPTTSDEVIEIIDGTLHVASWHRDFGLGQVTRRPQLLEAEEGGTHYYTALKLPPGLAWVVGPLFGPGIHDAFARFAVGLKAAAEAPGAQ